MEQGGKEGKKKKKGVMAVVSRAEEDSSGLAAWGEVYGVTVEGGGRGER